MQTETNSLAMQTNLYSESAKKHQKLHDTYLGLQSHKNLNAINDKKNIKFQTVYSTFVVGFEPYLRFSIM